MTNIKYKKCKFLLPFSKWSIGTGFFNREKLNKKKVLSEYPLKIIFKHKHKKENKERKKERKNGTKNHVLCGVWRQSPPDGNFSVNFFISV